jgi:hypothetical protein
MTHGKPWGSTMLAPPDIRRMHEVWVMCLCDEEPCRMEVYVSDVRIAYARIQELEAFMQRRGIAQATQW